MATRRPSRPMPIGLQQKVHRHTGESYWAVVALDTMPSGGVQILSPYNGAWQRPRGKSSVAVTFTDELEASAPDLEGFTVYVTREWLEAHFREPGWQDFLDSACRVLGVTVGIMTGLLPPEGVPVRIRGSRGVGSCVQGKGNGGGDAKGPGGHTAPLKPGGLAGAAVRRLLPFILLNLAFVALMLWLPRFVRWYNRTHR